MKELWGHYVMLGSSIIERQQADALLHLLCGSQQGTGPLPGNSERVLCVFAGEWLEVLSRGLALLNVHHHIVAGQLLPTPYILLSLT